MRRDEFWCAMAVFTIVGGACLVAIGYYGGVFAFIWGVLLAVCSLTIAYGLMWWKHVWTRIEEEGKR